TSPACTHRVERPRGCPLSMTIGFSTPIVVVRPPPAGVRDARGRPRTLWLGIALSVVGLLGLVLLTTFGSGTNPGASFAPFVGNGAQTFSSLGERIFLSGTDGNGTPIPRSTPSMYGMMLGQAGCAGCHGRDGRGGTVGAMMGSFRTPDIRWSALSSTQGAHEDGQAHAAYDEASFARAVRDGIDPEGARLNAPMPQWRLTDAEVAALVTYLKSLQ
ncbi:MAG: cytochrome c, partial [Actinobacteria bacterium]|nr:cytochrome c [Actinomycetota bacterium]